MRRHPALFSTLSLGLLASACNPPDMQPTPAEPVESRAKPEAEPVLLDLKGGEGGEGKADGKSSVVEVVKEIEAADAAAADAAAGEARAAGEAEAAVPAAVLERFFWASGAEGKTVIDMIDVADPSSGEDLVMKLAEAHRDPDGVDETLPEGADLPRGFALGDEWVVATTTGERRGPAIAFGAFGGAAETHFIVTLAGEFMGLAARPGDWPGATPTLRKAEPIDLSKGAGKAFLDAFLPALKAATHPSVQRALRRTRIRAEHLHVAEGAFVDGFTHLVAVTVVLDEYDVETGTIAGLLLADATGRLQAIHPLAVGMDGFLLHDLVDIEGDGQDEVVWESYYYEGAYYVLSAWDAAGRRTDRTLTGDGA